MPSKAKRRQMGLERKARQKERNKDFHAHQSVSREIARHRRSKELPVFSTISALLKRFNLSRAARREARKAGLKK